MRDRMIARLSEEFGSPRATAECVHWTLNSKLSGRHASIAITLSTWKSPEAIRVWVFDPSKQGLASTQHFEVEIPAQIEPVIGKVHDIVNGPESTPPPGEEFGSRVATLMTSCSEGVIEEALTKHL